jgi:hypothetical protein
VEQKAKPANTYDGGLSTEPFRNLVIRAWAERFGLTKKQMRILKLRNAHYWQLCQCRSDEARRLILGVSQ